MTIHPSRTTPGPLWRLRAKRKSLLLGCALGGALGMARGAEPALAQAINATPSTAAGSIDYSRISSPTPGSETITLNSSSAIIDWIPPNPPLPDPYVFLPQGNVVTFQNGISTPDFTVLNRILTTVPSRFEGTVLSRLVAGGGLASPGGTVLFSSPGGIVVGGTAQFDVGNLVLTSLTVVESSPGNFITPSGGFRFDRGAGAPDTAVIVEAGASILASSENSYVALVAPRVVQGGDVYVNGSTAYIGADQVEFSVNQGLFDIVVTAGSDNAVPVLHTGTTGGPASTGFGDNHNIYAVAVARNQAITMLLQGSMGYDPATVVGVENGAIILSAGYNVTAGLIDPTPVPAPAASIALSDGQFTSDVVGRATGDVTATATPDDPLAFDGSLVLEAIGAVSLVASGGAGITVGQTASLSGATVDIDSLSAGNFIVTSSTGATTIDIAGSGGTILVFAGGPASLGTLDAVNNLSVNASSITLAGAFAGDDITLNAAEDVVVGFAQAGDDFTATAGGTFNGGTVVTTGFGDDSEDVGGPAEGSNIRVAAGVDLRLDNGTAPNRIELSSTDGSILSGGALTADLLLATTPLDILLNNVFVVQTLDLAAPGGSIAGNRFESDGDIVLDAANSVNLPNAISGGDILIDAGGDLRLDNGTAPGLIDLASVNGSILSSGTLNANRLTAAAANDFLLNDVIVVADLDLTAAGGAIRGDRFTSDGDINLDASDEVSIVSADSGGSIAFLGGGDVRLDGGDAVGAISLTSSGGSVLSGDRLDGGGGGDGLGSGPIGLLTAGTDILATAALDIFVEDARAGDSILLNAGRDVGVRDLTAAQAIDVDALGTAAFDEDVSAPSISVTSSDIAIAATGSLGNSATQLVALTVVPDVRVGPGQTVLGGAAEGPGYTLTDAEADRISATTLRIQAPPTGTAADRPADVLVRDLSLAGTRIGLFDLRTTGIVQVEGNLLLAGVQPAGGIEIRATEGIRIVNPAGSIRVRDASGLTDGRLLLFTNHVWSASQSLIDQLRADPDFAGRDEALLANDGPVEPRGYIEAGDVVLSARDSLFVQNSGTSFNFAGITVRENTLRIVPAGTEPLAVFAFGRRINPDGSFVTNIAFFNEVEFQGRGGPVGYKDDAQFNLCFINTGACRLPLTDNPLPGGSDIIEQPVDGGFVVTLPLAGDDLVDTSFADEPLIEEPVTSGSDSILWDCDSDDDGDCDEDDTNG